MADPLTPGPEKHIADSMRSYFGTVRKPVTLMRAETDLLVRLLTSQYALLSARLHTLEKQEKKKPGRFYDMEMNQGCTELALIVSISGKLRESEE